MQAQYVTGCELNSVTFKWRVGLLALLDNLDKSVESPTFTAKNGIPLCLGFYITEVYFYSISQYKGIVQLIRLKRINSKDTGGPIAIAYNITITDKEGKKIKDAHSVYRFAKEDSCTSISIENIDISKPSLLEFVITAKITYNVGSLDPKTLLTEKPSQADTIITDCKKMFTLKSLSDVTAAVGKQTFAAHKVVLASRSDVFQAMFQRDTKEKKFNRVEIDDVEPQVFQAMLRFMYTDEMPEEMSQDLAKGLLAAADKYLIKPLKCRCEQYFIGCTAVENCIDFFTFARLHSAKELESHTSCYIADNLWFVMKTDAWKRFDTARRDMLEGKT